MKGRQRPRQGYAQTTIGREIDAMRMPLVLILTFWAVPLAFGETQFIYGPHRGNGNRAFFDLTGTPERVIFTGRVHKGQTHDPRVLGGQHLLVNKSGVEYRVVNYEYSLDQSRLSENETVETDVALTILPPGVDVSLSSGDELLVTHQYDAPFAPSGIQRTDLPGGGFPLRADCALTAVDLCHLLARPQRSRSSRSRAPGRWPLHVGLLQVRTHPRGPR